MEPAPAPSVSSIEAPSTTARVPSGYVPRQRADILELDMGDGVVLYDDGSSQVHHLSPSASIVWSLCRGEADVGELATDIADAYGLEPSEIEAQLTTTIAELEALGLVEDDRHIT